MRKTLFLIPVILLLGCSSEKPEIKEGSIVRLRSSWGRMVVEKIDGDKVHCIWEVEENSGLGYSKGYKREVFDLKTIVTAE